MRLVDDTTIYSTWQTLPEFSFVGRLTSSGPVLSLQQGFKYQMDLQAVLDDYGASIRINIELQNAPLITFEQGSGGDARGSVKRVNVSADATSGPQTIEQRQNTGTNGVVDYILNYRQATTQFGPKTADKLEELRDLMKAPEGMWAVPNCPGLYVNPNAMVPAPGKPRRKKWSLKGR